MRYAARLLLSLCALAFLTFFLTAPAPAKAAEIRLGILHGDVELFAYEIGLIELALDHVEGGHSLKIIDLPHVPQKRVMSLLEDGERINTFITGYSREREKRFLQVDIPITRGLLGHRVFMVPKGQEELLAGVQTADDLKNIMMGSGVDWMDTRVMEHAGVSVTKSTYDKLWTMLEAGRFQAFNRGIAEAPFEHQRNLEAGRAIALDQHLLVSYPHDAFVYVSPDHPEIQGLLWHGLHRAYETGAFLRYFYTHPSLAKMYKTIQPQTRTHIRLDNPFVSARIKDILPDYWHDFSK